MNFLYCHSLLKSQIVIRRCVLKAWVFQIQPSIQTYKKYGQPRSEKNREARKTGKRGTKLWRLNVFLLYYGTRTPLCISVKLADPRLKESDVWSVCWYCSGIMSEWLISFWLVIREYFDEDASESLTRQWLYRTCGAFRLILCFITYNNKYIYPRRSSIWSIDIIYIPFPTYFRLIRIGDAHGNLQMAIFSNWSAVVVLWRNGPLSQSMIAISLSRHPASTLPEKRWQVWSMFRAK